MRARRRRHRTVSRAAHPAPAPHVRPATILPPTHDPAPAAFTAFDLDPRLQRALADLGFVRTTPIQSAAIPIVLAGSDLIGCAQTGTGKTAAFLLPIMQRLLRHPGRHASTRVLVLAPTRELAVQIEDDFQGLAYHTDLSVAAVYGGVAAGPQQRALKAPVDVVVATPGRLLDHMRSADGRFDGLEVLVLDEADRMLDMGFWPSVRQIVSALPAARQTLLFSATMSDEVRELAAPLMRQPTLVRIGRTGGLASAITHRAQRVPAAEKATWLARFLRRTDESSLIFVRTKRGADRLARRLSAAGLRCAALHGDRTQGQRTAAVEGFRTGRYTALVATDIAARGLDIDGIGHVINFSVPDSVEAYVHRAGRTGRADRTGVALTLVAEEEFTALRALERSLNIRLGEPHAADAPVAE